MIKSTKNYSIAVLAARKKREELNISVSTFAKIMEVSRITIIRFENEESIVSGSLLLSICNYLAVDLNFIDSKK